MDGRILNDLSWSSFTSTLFLMRESTITDAPSFWADKRVLITGHTGFKGSWLALWLQHLGADVVGFALEPPSTPNLFERGRVAEGMVSLHGDIRDANAVYRAFEEYQPEIVFHMAAETLVRPSYEAPVDTYATNVMGTVHVLEAVRRTASVRAGVFVTSDKCYDNTEQAIWGFRETDAMGGNDPYSSSKGCSELVISAYQTSYFSTTSGAEPPQSVAAARAGNVIGGGDWATDRLIPDIVRAFGEGRPVHVRRPDALRPWQHVLEPLRGYMEVAKRLWTDGDRYAEGWNFGPDDDDAQPVQYVVEQMIEKWGPEASAVIDEGPHPHEATYLRLDCSKAHMRLGWRPRLGLDDALEWTVAWYQKARGLENMRPFTLEQIRRYEALSEGARDEETVTSSPSAVAS